MRYTTTFPNFYVKQAAAKRYGSMVGFYLGSFPAMLVTDFQLVRELFKVYFL